MPLRRQLHAVRGDGATNSSFVSIQHDQAEMALPIPCMNSHFRWPMGMCVTFWFDETLCGACHGDFETSLTAPCGCLRSLRFGAIQRELRDQPFVTPADDDPRL